MYLLTITIENIFSEDLTESNYDQNEFTVHLDVSMRGPHGFLSAANWPLLHVVYFNHVSQKTHFNNYIFFSVLWIYVFCIHMFWFDMVGFIIHAMERFTSNTILDWSCHPSW